MGNKSGEALLVILSVIVLGVSILYLATGGVEDHKVGIVLDDHQPSAALIDCIKVSERIPHSYIIFDTESQSCGIIYSDDTERVVDDVMERDGQNLIIWITGGKAGLGNWVRFQQELIENGQ